MIDYAAIFSNFTGSFPNIVANNVSAPAAGDGTEFIKALVDDNWGFSQALLDYTDDTPNSVTEAAGASQKLDSVVKIHANTTTQAVTGTHTVEEWDKKGVVLCTAALVTLTLAAGVGADETNRVLVINQTGSTININVGSTVETLVNGGNIEYIYDGTSEFIRANGQSGINILTKTADYNILDTDLSNYSELLIYVNPSDGDVIITNPTLSANIGKKITVIVTDLGGKVTIDGEGAEKIGGYSALQMQSKNDRLKIVAESGEWQIISYSAKYDTGWQNRASWQADKLGSSTVTYDTLVGTFTIGEVVTAASGVTGIIQSDTGSVLIVKNVTGIGIWINNESLTGATSGATALVNETTSNKNADTNVFHDLGLPLEMLNVSHMVSTDKTEAENRKTGDVLDKNGGANLGHFSLGVDTNNITMQTGQQGDAITTTAGLVTSLTSQDYHFRVLVEVKI